MEKKRALTKEGNVGEVRRVTFTNKVIEIREILQNPDIELEWTWDTGICPHRKNRITRTIIHKFYRIEILADERLKEEEITKADLFFLGDTIDNRRMLIPIETFNKVLEKSQKFKHLGGN